MQSLIINVDADGCAVNWHKSFVEHINHKYGTKYTVADFKKFDAASWMDSKIPVQAEIVRIGGFIDLEPMPGAIEGLRELVDAGHRVRITTAHSWFHPHVAAEKLTWFLNHTKFIHPKRVNLGHEKEYMVAHVAIDDNPDQIVKYKAIQPHIMMITVGYPYLHAAAWDASDYIISYDYPKLWPTIVDTIRSIAEAGIN